MKAEPKIIRTHCNECGQETKHDVVMEHTQHCSEVVDLSPRIEVSWSTTYSMLECRGCEDVSFRRTEWCSENDPIDGPVPGIYFPPRVSRRNPAWADRLEVPSDYSGLLNEIYVALHADSRRLAMMGARALIDAVIRRNVGDQENFGKGLKSISEKGLISEKSREIIAAAVDAGHASAHRGHCPSSEDINIVIDIVENVIHSELLAEQVQALKATTPRRVRISSRKKSDQENASN